MLHQTILEIGLTLVLLQYIAAAFSGTLTAQQMWKNFAGTSILPLVWHGGIWYDIPLALWLAELVRRHGEWTHLQWAIAVVIGFLASWYMHTHVYAPATRANPDPKVVVTQEAHVQYGKLTFVGVLHAIFFGIMFAVVILEYVFSKAPAPAELWMTSAILIGLLFVGNHFVLGLVKWWTGGFPYEYEGSPLTSVTGWATLVGGIIAAVLVTLARIYIW